MPLTRSQQRLIARAKARDKRLTTITDTRLAHNLAQSSAALRLSSEAYCRMASRSPPLLYLTPERVQRRFEDIRGLFALTEAQARMLVRRRPSILTYGAKRLYTAAVALTRRVGLPKHRLATLVVRCPHLVCLKTETLQEKVTGNAAALGLTRAAFLACASRCPALLVYRPKRLTEIITQSALVLGMSPEVYRTLAVRHPGSVTRRPQSRQALVAPLQRLARACGHPAGMERILLTAPAALSYAASSIEAKALVRELGLFSASFGTMLTLPQRRIEALLGEHARSHGRRGHALWTTWRTQGYVTRRHRPRTRLATASAGEPLIG